MPARALWFALAILVVVGVPVLVYYLFGVPELALPSQWADVEVDIADGSLPSGTVVNVIGGLFLVSWLGGVGLLIAMLAGRDPSSSRSRSTTADVGDFAPPATAEASHFEPSLAADTPELTPDIEMGAAPAAESDEPWYRQGPPIFDRPFSDDYPRVIVPADEMPPDESPGESVWPSDPVAADTGFGYDMPPANPPADDGITDAEIVGEPAAASPDDPPMIVPVRAYYFTRAEDTLRSIAAQFLQAPKRWEELRGLNAASPGVASMGPDIVLPVGTALALPGDPLPWGKPDPVYLWTLAEKFLFTAWGREPTPEEVVPFWRGLTGGHQLASGMPTAPPPHLAPPTEFEAAAPGAFVPEPAAPEGMSIVGDGAATAPAPAMDPWTAPADMQPPGAAAQPSHIAQEPPDLPVYPAQDPPPGYESPLVAPPYEPATAYDTPAAPTHEPPPGYESPLPPPQEPAAAYDSPIAPPQEPATTYDAPAPRPDDPSAYDSPVPPSHEPPPGYESPLTFDAPAPPSHDPAAYDSPVPPSHEPPPALEQQPPAPASPHSYDTPAPPTFEPPPGYDTPAPPTFEPPPGYDTPAPPLPPTQEPPPAYESPVPPSHEPPPALEQQPPAPASPHSYDAPAPPTFEPPPGYEPPAPTQEPPPAYESPVPPSHEPPPAYEQQPPLEPAQPAARQPGEMDLGPIEPEPATFVEDEAPRMPSFLPSLTGADLTAAAPEAEVVTSSNRSLAGTAIGDAMMLWQLSRVRRRGSRQDEIDPMEESLKQNARVDSLNLIEAAMRHLRAVTVGQLREKPSVLAVRVGTYGFEVLLNRPAQAPEGWQVASGGYVLELPRDVTADDLSAPGQGPTLCPALVPVGDTVEGPLLLNIEEIGCLIVSGPTSPTVNLLNAVVGTLGSSPLAADIRIITVGMETPTGVPGWSNVHSTSFDSPQLEELISTAHTGSGASLDILVVGPGNDLLIQRAGQVANTPGSRLALVGATSSVAARWPWRIHVDETTTAVVHPIACTMAAAQAMAPTMSQLLSEAPDPSLLAPPRF